MVIDDTRSIFYDILHLYDEDSYVTLPFTPFTLRLIIIFVWIGAMLACIGSFYSDYYLGGFVRKMIERGAHSPESAVGYESLGYRRISFLLYSLRDESYLRRSVLSADESTKMSKNGNIIKKMAYEKSFYIPQDKVEFVKKRFRRSKSAVWMLILVLISIVLLFGVCYIYGPYFMSILDSML